LEIHMRLYQYKPSTAMGLLSVMYVRSETDG